MPNSALPDHLNPDKNPLAWKNTDWDNKWQRWLIPHKGWFAYGPRAIQWWAKWREMPFVVLALFGKGESRWEESNGAFALRAPNNPVVLFQPHVVYLSRIQYWTDWSIQVQWPLFFAFHVKFRGKMLYGYLGCMRDADRVFWFPSAFIGTVFK